jgi:hypothetical protein
VGYRGLVKEENHDFSFWIDTVSGI